MSTINFFIISGSNQAKHKEEKVKSYLKLGVLSFLVLLSHDGEPPE